MIRTALVAAAAVMLGATAVGAQDPIAARQDLMKLLGRNMYGVMGRMVRAENPEPFDRAKVDAALAQLAENVPKIKALYPDNSKPAAPPAQGFYASAKIWENKADFDQWPVKVAQAIEANRSKATSLDGLKVAFAAINAQCSGCHENYRLRAR